MAKKRAKKENKSSGFSVTGFIIGLLALIFCWIPFFGLILAILGIIFSGVGMARGLKGLAIAGLVISIVAIIPAIIVTLGILALISVANLA